MNFLVPACSAVACPGKGDRCIVRSKARVLVVEADMEFSPCSETEKQCRILGLAAKIASSILQFCLLQCWSDNTGHCEGGLIIREEPGIAREAELNQVSHIDFYSNVALCLQLQSPDSVIKLST